MLELWPQAPTGIYSISATSIFFIAVIKRFQGDACKTDVQKTRGCRPCAQPKPAYRPTPLWRLPLDNLLMNIFEALRSSHTTQRSLADNLIKTSGDSKERDLLFKELKAELAAHAAAEERFFYVPLIAHDMTQEPSRHGIAEHHEMDELVEKLEKTELSSPARC